MNIKIISLAIVAALLLGGAYVWYVQNKAEEPDCCGVAQPEAVQKPTVSKILSAPIAAALAPEVALTVITSSGSTRYMLNTKGLLARSVSGKEGKSVAALTDDDRLALNKLLSRYNLAELESDQTLDPGLPYNDLVITQGGQTYHLHLWSSENPGYYLTLDLQNLFAQKFLATE